jgi:hypothetical protein
MQSAWKISRMPFIYCHRPDDPADRRILSKLQAAGWCDPVVTESQGEGSDFTTIAWTQTGREALIALGYFLRELERTSFPLDRDELQFLKGYAELVLNSASPPQSPLPPA